MAFSIAGATMQKMWEGPCWDVVGLRTKASVWNVPGKFGPHGEKEPFALAEAVEFRPSVLAETLKSRALIGLHLMAAESASVSSGSQSLDLRTRGGVAARQNPDYFFI